MKISSVAAVSHAATRLGRLWRVVVLFYGANLITAVLVITPLATLLAARYSNSLESDRLFSHFDPAVVLEFYQASPLLAWPLLPVGLLAGALYMLLSTFFAGGAVGVMVDPKRTFFGECGRHFPQFLRLLLWSLPFYAAVLVVNSVISKATGKLSEDSMQAAPWTVISWFRASLVFTLAAMVNVMFDWAKLLVVAERRKSAFWAVVDAVRLISTARFTVAGVFVVTQIFAAASLLLYHGLTEIAPQNGLSMVALVFLLRQVYMLARHWIRLLTWQADILVYESMVPVLREPQLSLSSTMVAPEPPSDGVPG